MKTHNRHYSLPWVGGYEMLWKYHSHLYKVKIQGYFEIFHNSLIQNNYPSWGKPLGSPHKYSWALLIALDDAIWHAIHSSQAHSPVLKFQGRWLASVELCCRGMLCVRILSLFSTWWKTRRMDRRKNEGQLTTQQQIEGWKTKEHRAWT